MEEKALVERIKEKRKAAGLTQPQMSELLGIPLPTIKKWDSRAREPADWVAALVIDKLEEIRRGRKEGVKLDLMDFKETQDFLAQVADVEDRLEKERKAYEKLSPQDQERIDHNLKVLAAFHSNAIEGNPMSLDEVKDLLGWKNG